MQIIKMKKRGMILQGDLAAVEEKLTKSTTQVADLLEERSRLTTRVQDSQSIIENLENYKTRIEYDFDQMKQKLESLQAQ